MAYLEYFRGNAVDNRHDYECFAAPAGYLFITQHGVTGARRILLPRCSHG